MANGKQYWLMVNSISLMNAEKSLKYTQNFVFLVKANVQQLWALEVLKYKQLWEQEPDPNYL